MKYLLAVVTICFVARVAAQSGAVPAQPGVMLPQSRIVPARVAAQSGSEPARVVTGLNEAWLFAKDTASVGADGKNVSLTADAHKRLSLPVDADKRFSLPAEAHKQIAWQPVQLPHTWNAQDVMDDDPGYYRSIGYYKKKWTVNASWQSKKVFLYFEGVGQVAEVYINGKLAGSHTGGYTGFSVAVSTFLRFDGKDNVNEILVKVDNSYQSHIAPLSADFTFYGGIYRDVYAEALEDVHFDRSDHGSPGVWVTTPDLTATRAFVEVKAQVVNESGKFRKLVMRSVLLDKTGNVVFGGHEVLLSRAANRQYTLTFPTLSAPHLWSPEDPYCYTLITTIVDGASHKVLDQYTNTVGFRWFSFDAGKGFLLNGKPYKLVGTSRHQDYAGLGNAVPDELARKDLALLKDMGGNFLRIAHYPQDPSILEACDKMGILASVEIPVVNEITETDSFYNQCITMQQEMIRQNCNHPSVIIWCYMNEVLLRPHFNDDKPRQEVYFKNIAQLARRLDSVTRKEDPTRYTMLVNHGDFNKYRSVGLTDIPMIVGWNLYQGWYGGNVTDFPSFLDRHHKELPGKPLMVTEYGADADPRIRSLVPQRFDKSVEYTTAFHQYYLTEMLKRPFVVGAVVWNLADFNSETREETMPHINNKGLLMWNRTAKDPWYYYKAALSKEPFVHFASSYWTVRAGVADSGRQVCSQPVEVATNLPEATLVVNGVNLGVQQSNNGLIGWKVPFRDGGNTLVVTGTQQGQAFTDQLHVDFHLLPRLLKDTITSFSQINILLGAQRYYLEESKKQVWIPDQPYTPGSWGYIGGKPFKVANGRLPYGTDKNIQGTDDDPLYQTQQTGIDQYRLDVPVGTYELVLHFAELQGGTVKGLPYNLNGADRKEEAAARIFTVAVNDVPALENFNMAQQYGVSTAIAKKVRVSVNDQQGLRIQFTSISGEPVLNALQVTRLY